MAGFLYQGDDSHSSRPRIAATSPKTSVWRSVIIPIGLATILSAASAEAKALDWLSGKRGTSRPQTKKIELPAAGSERSVPEISGGDLPGFFAQEIQPDVTGKKLNVYQFVESHWVHSRKILETAVRNISAKIPERKVTDITKKLYAVNVFTTRESLKAAASTLTQLNNTGGRLQAQLGDLSRIVTSPREETLANLENAVAAIQKTNQEIFGITKAQIAGSELLIDSGSESYQTLELVPLLSITPVDLMVRSSKQFMKQIQSNHEAFKGLLLNVQNSCEQTAAGLELIGTIVKSSLKYSDHFAFRQYPLVNLPVPTREKLFAQIGAVQNVVRGIGNTLSIGESHVKNSAQQFNHLVTNLGTKIQDSLQYLTAVDLTSGNMPQISVYAHNQISGLYQRTRESVNQLKMTMAKAGRANLQGAQPMVSIETRDEAADRQGARAGSMKLPLFLLGGKPEPERANAGLPKATSNLLSNDDLPGGQTMVLYSEKPPRLSDGFKPEELDILRKEIGGEMGLSEENPDIIHHSPDRLLELSAGNADSEESLLENFQPGPEKAMGSLSMVRTKQSGSFKATDDLEIFPMDTGSLEESGELLPMLKLDDPLNFPELD
jgi:hypothetical protein